MFTSSEYFDMLVLYGQCDKQWRLVQEGQMRNAPPKQILNIKGGN
jgi:hypothetical protein